MSSCITYAILPLANIVPSDWTCNPGLHDEGVPDAVPMITGCCLLQAGPALGNWSSADLHELYCCNSAV